MKVAFFADTHIGYATRCREDPRYKINARLADGYRALKDTVDGILREGDVEAVLHGGDLFHRSHPSVSDVLFARKHLMRLVNAGIPVYGVTGNHDFANERGKYPATALFHDPEHGLTFATHKPIHVNLAEGVEVSLIPHASLLGESGVFPEPGGDVSFLVTHGAAAVPGHEMFTCADSPGEAVIPYTTLNQPWSATLLGHYHTMGPLPMFKEGQGQAWYAGSSLRRGFSDAPGGRGWLLLTINSPRDIKIERKYINQRDQADLPVIDAAGLTAEEVEERIVVNLGNVADIRVDGSILRQRVSNITAATRRSVSTTRIADITRNALVWQLEFFRPEELDYRPLDHHERAVESLTTAKVSDLPSMWQTWFPEYSTGVGMDERVAEHVNVAGAQLLKDVTMAEENES